MSDPVWFIDENGNRRLLARHVARRLHPEWREESRVLAAKRASAGDGEGEPAEQADADSGRKADKKRS